MAIVGMHALMYSKKATETRQLFEEVLGFSSVDAGGGWQIFAAPPAELAIHPSEDREYHQLYFMCDDIESTIAELATKGVVTALITEQRWGRVTSMRLPSGEEFGLYEPKHPMAIRVNS